MWDRLGNTPSLSHRWLAELVSRDFGKPLYAVTSTGRKMQSLNQHVREYLRKFISFSHAPGFAVLVDGSWGSGKTFLVKEAVAAHTPGGKKGDVYISLYGLTSTEEIDAALFQAVLPLLSSKPFRLLGRVGKAALKMVNFDADEFRASDVLEKFDSKVYVFDDLERCNAELNSVLGYINEFVEHSGCKVIIAANEKEIGDKELYGRWREKIVGKSFKVTPEFDSAFSAFAAQLENKEARAAIERLKPAIRTTFDQSQTNNLRILRQTLWDLEQLYAVISERHREKEHAIEILVRTVCALSLELKAGNILDEHLQRLDGLRYSFKSNGDVGDPLVAASKRYPDFKLVDTPLSSHALRDLLIEGFVDAAVIDRSLDESKHFADPQTEPPWRVLWWAILRDEKAFTEALAEVERQFKEREFVIPGEVLHIFGLRLWLQKQRLLKGGHRAIVAECRRYVDDLYATKRLLPLPRDGDWGEHLDMGYGSLGFHERDTPDFADLFQYLRAKRQTALEDQYPDWCQSLMSEMEVDAGLFARRICRNPSGDSIYATVPLLKAILATEFVDRVMKLSAEKQDQVFGALHQRYDYGLIERDLAPEKHWLWEVREALRKLEADVSGLREMQIDRYAKLYLNPVLDIPAQA